MEVPPSPPGGVHIIYLGPGVPPGPENLYPISDQNIQFSIPYFRPDSQNVCPISDPVMCAISELSIDLRRRGLRDAPNDVRVYVFFAINVHGNTHFSKNGIPDQTDGIYSLFQTKIAKSIPYFRLEMLENDTILGGTYPYGLWEYHPWALPPPEMLPEQCLSAWETPLKCLRNLTNSALYNFPFDWCQAQQGKLGEPSSIFFRVSVFNISKRETPQNVDQT